MTIDEGVLAQRSGLSSPEAQRFLADSPKRLLIGGNWVPAISGSELDVYDPTSEKVIASVAAAGADDVDRAVVAARDAFDHGPWPRMSPAARGTVLRRFAGLIDAHREELSQLESLNNGMALQTARPTIAAAAETVRYFATSAEHSHGDTPQTDAASFHYTLRDPIGVCAAIIPWNSPITNFVWKVSPALAAGNVLLLKPAETTPLTAVRLGELMIEAGLPAGVLNILLGFGDPAGAALAQHPHVDKISFTGSTRTGKTILHASELNLKRVSLELGGKSPNIVFDDADLGAAVAASVTGFVAITGQVCLAGTRLFVQRGIHDRFVAAMVDAVSALRVGDPLDPATTVGPLASKAQFDRVSSYLSLGKDEGASAVVGGGVLDRPGYFVEPTVFVGVTNAMTIAREEIFGPVLSVIPFDDEAEALALANDSPYGLAAAVWTNDLRRAHHVSRSLRAGTVWVNDYFKLDPTMPFGGYKQSGIGREFGIDWYLSYTEAKSVFVTLGPPDRATA
jgi:acyl-CoA reductase-like NAD-dependent aldehyde dehydrogenase